MITSFAHNLQFNCLYLNADLRIHIVIIGGMDSIGKIERIFEPGGFTIASYYFN